jgi:hypothetical protein
MLTVALIGVGILVAISSVLTEQATVSPTTRLSVVAQISPPRAYNPETGDVVELRDNKWQPASREIAVAVLRRHANSGDEKAKAALGRIEQRPLEWLEEGRPVEVGCPSDFPLKVTITNRSDQTLMRAPLSLVGRFPGTSTNQLPSSIRRLEWDLILPPWYAASNCYSAPANLSTGLSISATLEPYGAVLQKTEPWMLTEARAWRVIPPCKNGAKTCRPLDRDWQGGAPPAGFTIAEDGNMTIE